jgi:hypothetical protein
MFKNENYALISVSELKNGADLFYYLWTFLTLPVGSAILFSLLIYYSFKANGKMDFLIIIGMVLLVEYLLYTHLASPLDYLNGVFNAIIGIVLLFLFFYKSTLFYKN